MSKYIPQIISSGIFMVSKTSEKVVKFITIVVSDEKFLWSSQPIQTIQPENTKHCYIKNGNDETNDEISMVPSGFSEINERKYEYLHMNEQKPNNHESEL